MTGDFPQAHSLDQARFAAIAKGWPALYVALCADLAAVAFVHVNLTPWWAWGMFPLFLLPKAVLWLAMWRGRRDPIPSTQDCARAVRVLAWEVVFCVGIIVLWQVWLTQWGTPSSLLLLALCMGGQMVFILFGLLHLRVASVVAAIFCLMGMTLIAVRAAALGSGGTDAIGITVLLVGGLSGLSYLAYNTYEDFRSLVISRLSLARKNEQIEALNEATLRIANTDMLTEIGNRRSCFHELDKALAEARRTGRPVSFGVIDLDGFKGVNDTNGHLVGDRLLTAMAARLKDNLAAHGEVFRLGGDEFAFIVFGTDEEAALLAIGNEIIASVRQPIHIIGLTLMLGCSVGFASFPKTAATATELYDRADYVLYQAKRAGRARTVVFDEEHRQAVEASARIEAALKDADLDAELFLAFQPVVDPRSGRTPFLEALPRWRSPALGLVPPGRFMVVAEQSGLVSTLTPILLGKALAAAGRWPEEVGVSVNLSRLDILAPEKVLALVAILGRSGVAPGRVAFEVPEAALAKDMDRAIDGLRHLKATGARLVLDNVGVGRSSFAQIQALGLDRIKIGPELAGDLADSEASRTIVRSVAAMAREFSLGCVVEGVATREQFDLLRGIDGVLLQGDLCARPMEEEDVQGFLVGNADMRSGNERHRATAS